MKFSIKDFIFCAVTDGSDLDWLSESDSIDKENDSDGVNDSEHEDDTLKRSVSCYFVIHVN